MPFVISIFANLKNRGIKYSVLILPALLLFAECKKKDDPQAQSPVVVNEPPSKSTVSFYIVAFDSLGGTEQTADGIEVKIMQTGQAALTGTAGNVSFGEVPYGLITPVITKEGYEGPPQGIEVKSPSMSVSLPCAKRSDFRILNLTGKVVNQDTINISFSFDKAVPAGKFVRIAVLSSTDSLLSPDHYSTVDVITTGAKDNEINVAHLPALKAALDQSQDPGFYLGVVALSYGLFESNLQSKPVLLGDNLFYPHNLALTKNW
jgi:hypothetical protein